MVTIKDVARAAGMDPSTVSRAFNEPELVKEETREKIFELCQKMGYIPNSLARGLVKRRTQNIGMLVPNIANPYYSELMVLVGDTAREQGYNVLWCNSFLNYELEERYFRLLVENQMDGIIVHPISGRNIDRFRKYIDRVPIVFIGDLPPDIDFPCVCTNNVAGSMLAVEHLAECGCHSIAYVGANPERIAHVSRVNGFLEATERLRIAGEVVRSEHQYDSTFDRGYHFFNELLDSGKPLPDGIMAVSDYAAMGILKACSERGLSVPKDFMLIGFDDISFSSLPQIELSTIAPNKKMVVDLAMDMLCNIIRAEDYERIHVVNPHLVPRATTYVK